jgi:integrase
VWNAADAVEGHGGIIVKLLILTGQRRGEISSLQKSWIQNVYDKESCNKCHDKEKSDCGVAQLVEHSAVNRVVAGSSPAAAAICLPTTITKNKRSHTFPLGNVACSILISYPSENSLLFPARGSTETAFNGWSKTKAQLDSKVRANSADLQPWTLHDLRRTYATNLQRLGIRLEVIEALLNHVSGTRAGIVGVYQRHQYEAEMREAVTQFDDWFAKVILAE